MISKVMTDQGWIDGAVAACWRRLPGREENKYPEFDPATIQQVNIVSTKQPQAGENSKT